MKVNHPFEGTKVQVVEVSICHMVWIYIFFPIDMTIMYIPIVLFLYDIHGYVYIDRIS